MSLVGVRDIIGTTKRKPQFPAAFAIVIIMYGTVDLQVRHNMETNKFGILSLTPGRYKNIKGMLNPRPFMSKRRGKRFLDCIDKDIGVRPH